MNSNFMLIGAGLVLVVGVFFLLCFKNGDVKSAQALLKEGALLIDVRSAGEFKSGYLENARNIPVDQLGAHLEEVEQWAGGKDQAIVVYCASGMRSGVAKRTLNSAGFSKVENGGAMSGLKP